MTIQTYNTLFGIFNVYANDSAFVEEFKRGNVWEFNIVKRILELLPTNGVVLDIGAHIGTHSIPYALSKPELNIVSFEPQRKIRELLEQNIVLNSIKNITVNSSACGHIMGSLRLAGDFTSDGYDPSLTVDYNSNIPMNFGGLGLTNDIRGELVDVIKVDSLALDNVKFIKIDVEGAEKLVIYGAQETIYKCRPILLIEESDKDLSSLYSDESNNMRSFSINAYLSSLGYIREDLGNSNYLYISTYENKTVVNLEQYELTKYSESGEDGILDTILNLFGETNKFFVEIGTGDGTQCNTRAIREFRGFNGILFDMNYQDMNINLYKYTITVENVICILNDKNVPKDLDVLSIDIDSYDFYVLEEILKYYTPRIFICEYNATHLPSEDKIILKGSSTFNGNYFGASINSFYKLGRKYGYSLVYANNKGVNLFFIKDEVIVNSKYTIQYINNVDMIYKTPKYGSGPNGGHPADIFNMMYTSTDSIWR